MKSRKSDQLKRTAKDKQRRRKATRNLLKSIETLEVRQLLAADMQLLDPSYAPADLYTAGLVAEGEDATNGPSFSTGESGNPNNSFSQAEPLPFGTAPGQFPIVNVSGSTFVPNPGGNTNPGFDEDWFYANLQGGDIVDVRLLGANNPTPFDVTILDSSRIEIGGRADPTGPIYPSISPLSTDGTVSFAKVIPADGAYYFRVAGGDANYSLELKAYRPTLEKETLGTRQIVYLDFDGASVRGERYSATAVGNVRLRSMREAFFAAGIDLSDAEHLRLVESIVLRVEEDFQGSLPASGNNGYFTEDGIPGHFDVLFVDNITNPDFDPFGSPNITTVIVGYDPLANIVTAGLFGISDSIDIGNFETDGQLLTFTETHIPIVQQIPRAPSVPELEAHAQALATTISHELGHNFGTLHQQNNAILRIMDQNPATDVNGLADLVGVGPDGIFGTADDTDYDFGTDFYADSEGFIGRQDAALAIAFSLSTGKGQSASVTGTVFNDRNSNRVFDSVDAPLEGVRVYADANNDGVYTVGEFTAFSGPDGSYLLSVPAGPQIIRQETPFGFRGTTPANNAIGVDLAVGASVSGINFGNELLDLTVNGTKYNDVNANGVQDPGESTIEGVWVYIDLDGDNRIDIGEPADQTAADGTYNLAFPGPGTYSVREVIPPGFVQTYPGISNDGNEANDFEHTVVLTGDPMQDAIAASGLDFGNRLTVDFGDAPQSYGSASHGFVEQIILGAQWDAEEGSLFSTNADGDDNNNLDDEDGVILARPLVVGSTNNRVSVTAVNTTGAPAYLHAWFDYDHDGVFTSGEKAISNQLVNTGTAVVAFAAPANAQLGATVARFRYTTEQNLAATGDASDGEVEDYIFDVVATLQIANDDAFTVARSSVLNELDVLANDFNLPGETLNIVNTSGSQAGAIIQVNANRDRILYTPPAAFIGTDVFTYTVMNSGGDFDEATVVIDVQLFFENPLAIDDSFDVPTNSVDIPINVLANDVEGQNGALIIISATQPDKGGSVAIATGGKSLRYTPARDFGGTEFFTYTVADSGGNQSTAQVTLHTLPGARADDDVLIQMVATDLSGNPITAIEQGQEFLIQVVVDDLRYDAGNPGVAAGVYSAYADLLYDRQLVSTVAPSDPNSGFNFDVTFLNDYLNFQNGDASVPGIIDEFGAFNDRQVLNESEPWVLAAITFTASSPGIASFMPDPADSVPPNDTLLFDTPGSVVPDERIRYIGTSLEVVGDGVEFPVAVDDSVPGAIPAGSFGFPIDVLANDRPGSTGQIRLNSVTDGTSGVTAIDNRGTSDPSDDRVLYTPNGGFNGSDQFTYAIQDIRGIQSTATVTLRVGQADADDIVGLRLSATDLSGNAIDSVTVGGQFQLRGYVQDLRGFGNDRGVFAAYEDVLYSSSLVSPVPSTTNDPDLGFQVEFGPNYQEVFSGDIRTPGLINEIGAVQAGQNPLGTAELLLFVVTMTANSVGTASFIGDPADISPLHDTLTFEPPAAVDFSQITYGFDSLSIVSAGGAGSGEGRFHNSRNQFDVNNDGYISPIDALGVINSLNSSGSRTLATGGGEGEDGGHLYIDVNADGSLSPIDALLVINRLNSGGSGEGEFAPPAGAGLAASPTHDRVAEQPLAGQPVEQTLTSGKIGTRLTGVIAGPAGSDLLAGRASDDGSSSNLDELIDQIALDVDETWKERFQL